MKGSDALHELAVCCAASLISTTPCEGVTVTMTHNRTMASMVVPNTSTLVEVEQVTDGSWCVTAYHASVETRTVPRPVHAPNLYLALQMALQPL